jgi:RNA polymerase sigma factor (sigma-70 family)
MKTSQETGVLGHVRRMFRRHELESLSDGELMDLFLTQREQSAFALLVERLGPMVLGVCGRLLLHTQDAEDAFQATFLVLIRKGRSIHPRAKVGCWLYGVACRTAQEARRLARRRRAREVHVDALPEPVARPKREDDLAPVLDEEMQRLPAKYRLPIVLCDLQGKMHKEAADLLGWPQGTLSGRLTRARQELARRLQRRGVEYVGVAGSVLAEKAIALVPPTLAAATAQAGAAASASATKLVPSHIEVIVQGVVRSMFWSHVMKSVALIALFITLLGGSVVLLQAATSGGRADSSSRSGERSSSTAPASSSASRSVSPAPEAKRLELADAEKLVRKFIFDENPKMNPDATFPLDEITSDTVWKRLHVQAFKVNKGVRSHECYVIKAGTVYHIGQAFGGFGVRSLGVADLDKSGRPTLVYVFSWGSGVHRAHVGMFDVGAKEPKEYVAPEVYFSATTEDPELTFKDDQTVEAHVGEQQLGHLSLEGKDDTKKLRLILEEKLPDEVRQRIRSKQEVKPGSTP